ncbi:MAG: acetate kinase [Clostridia bacterium]|nr:acetate kinase [Clostridia bacterium]
MKILVVNCGSSSLKYQLIEMENEEVLASGKCDRIGVKGIDSPFIEYKGKDGKKLKKELDLPNHTVAFEEVVKYLLDPEVGAIKDLSEINGIGHRIVNGGPKLGCSMLITDEVMEEYTKAIEYAPLHNPAHIQGIEACTKIMPGIPQALVFDTSFHTTIPEYASLYAIPYEFYEKYGIKRYGAHGTSHKFITKEAAKVLGKDINDVNIISCHLGNGASIAAVKNGKCVDTTMGLTPLEGLVMGTRSGDLDPAVLEFVMKKENLSIDEMMTVLNKKSGLLGISGITGDIRDLKGLIAEGNERAKLAVDMFAYRVRKYIGAYMAVLGHVDAIIFEGGIGEHNPDVISKAVSGLEELGIKYDNSHNSDEMYEGIVSTPDSKIKMYIIPTNEELEIANETMELVK